MCVALRLDLVLELTRIRRVGQHRLLQAASPVENADNPATLRSRVFERDYPKQSETKYKSPIGAGVGDSNYADTFVANAVNPAGQQNEAGGGDH